MLTGHQSKKPTKRQRADAFVARSFNDAIAWKAARVLLRRVQDDPAPIDPELRAAVDRFLANHPE